MEGTQAGRRRIISAARWFYGSMLLCVYAGIRFWNPPPTSVRTFSRGVVFMGACVGALGALLVWALERRRPRLLRPMAHLMRRLLMLGGAPVFYMVELSLHSALVEELLFRWVLPSAIGWGWAAALFSVLHWPFAPQMRPWPLTALCAAAVFSALVVWTGSVWSAVAAHFVFNFLQMWRMNSDSMEEETPVEETNGS